MLSIMMITIVIITMIIVIIVFVKFVMLVVFVFMFFRVYSVIVRIVVLFVFQPRSYLSTCSTAYFRSIILEIFDTASATSSPNTVSDLSITFKSSMATLMA